MASDPTSEAHAADPLWRRPGRPRIFETPPDFWTAAVAYFQWCEANPILRSEMVKTKDGASLVPVPHLRAMTIEGFCLHAGIGVQSWYDYKARQEFSEVIARVEAVMREQKFTGAAAGVLNPNIIARDLGLVDRKEATQNVVFLEAGDEAV